MTDMEENNKKCVMEEEEEGQDGTRDEGTNLRETEVKGLELDARTYDGKRECLALSST